MTSTVGIDLYILEEEKKQYDMRPDIWIFVPNVFFKSLFAEIYIKNKTILVGVYRPNIAPNADTVTPPPF